MREFSNCGTPLDLSRNAQIRAFFYYCTPSDFGLKLSRSLDELRGQGACSAHVIGFQVTDDSGDARKNWYVVVQYTLRDDEGDGGSGERRPSKN